MNNENPQSKESEVLDDRRAGLVDRKRHIDSESDFEEDLPMAPRAPQQGEYSNTEPPKMDSILDLDLDTFNSSSANDYRNPASPPSSPTRAFPGCSQISNYSIQKKIGEGTFGEVSLATHKTNRKRVALKRILIHNEREGMPITALREIRILKKIKHPNIIRLVEMAVKSGVRERKESGMAFMVFPYMEHDLDGLLQNPLVKLNPSQIKSYMKQLLSGVDHLHKSFILHRDIKSDLN